MHSSTTMEVSPKTISLLFNAEVFLTHSIIVFFYLPTLEFHISEAPCFMLQRAVDMPYVID